MGLADSMLESDIVIDFLQGVPGARAALEEVARQGLACVSAWSAAEVMGAAAKTQREATEGLLGSIRVQAIDEEVALLAGEYFAGGHGDELELGNCIVAAAAQKLGAVLVSKGRRRYPRGITVALVAY